MENHNPSPRMEPRVLLIGNYLNDRQESMQRFSEALLAGLKAQGVKAELLRPGAFFGRLKPTATGLGKWLGYLDKFLVFPFVLRPRVTKFDVVHICDHSNAHYTRYLQNVPHLVTCNDMLAIRSARGEFRKNPTGWTGRALQNIILRGLRRARWLTCISEATRLDVLRLTGLPESRVATTLMGLNYPYSPVGSCAKKEPYLLHVGGNQWYKNRPGVLTIYAEVRRLCGEHPPGLIMVGPPLHHLPPGVESRTGVDNEQLRALYSQAELLLFPSLEEGFGWPIVEAQACGCRVVTTGKAPMTEVGGDSAFYIENPDDPTAAARTAMEALNQQPDKRNETIARGLTNAGRFSIEIMVKKYRKLYQEVAQ